MSQSKNQLWELIGQITVQVEQLMEQDKDTKDALSYLSEKLTRLIDLHQKCLEQEKNMRAKQLALMRERNVYLEKCRKIEAFGDQVNWKDNEQNLMQEIQKDEYPMMMREREYDVDHGQSRKMRILAYYLPKDQFERIQDSEGVYEGDIIEKQLEASDNNHNINKGRTQKILAKIKHGFGVKLFSNGDLYNGEWKDNKMHGRGGFYFQQDNYFFKGDFYEGQISGRGIFFYSETQDFYLGEVKEGKCHGKGLYYTHENETWELNEYEHGQVTKNLKKGLGRAQSLEITKEMNQTDDPQFQDIYIKPKDFFYEHYEGDVVNGKYEGNGILFHKDGSRFEGSWKSNKPNGLGVTVHSDQKFDIGEYKNGLLQGFGRVQFQHGDVYRGNFYKGRMQGLGLYIYHSQQTWLFAYFRNNNIGQELERGQVQRTSGLMPTYSYLESKFKSQIARNEEQADIEYIESAIQVSAEKKRKLKQSYDHHSLIDDGNNNASEYTQSRNQSPSKKKLVNILIEETKTKKHPDNQSNYCHIY
eukprot:403353219